MRHLFAGQDQDAPIIPGGNGLKSRHECGGARGRRGFNPRRRHTGQTHRIGDQRSDIAVARKFLGIHHPDVESVKFIVAGKRPLRCFGKNLAEGTGILTEPRQGDAGNVNGLHTTILTSYWKVAR
jgi:hypothetical protein